jgi:ankyrin repeat protein
MDDLMNPIIVAMDNDEPVDVIREIVDDSPELLRRRDDDGYLPIHYASSQIRTNGLAYVLCLLEMWPESARERTDSVSGFLPAHLICMDPGNENGDDGSVLDMVRAVVMAYPHALEERDNDGNLPLHLAFHTWPPPHCVTSFLVEMHPLAVQARNDYGDVPFHEAVYCYAPTIPDLRLLFEQWPDCVRQRDNRGCVPFFSAAANDLVPEEVLHYLFGLWPDAIHQRDDQGWTPLHVAARKGFVIAVEFLLQQSPEMALAKSAAGRTPLHDAASLGGSATVTRLIVERCPESIREPCHEGAAGPSRGCEQREH